MGKLDASELAYAADLLGRDLLRALFRRDIPYNPLFEGMPFDREYGDSASRLSIRFSGVGANMTLAGFLHWAGLFFDGPLTLEHFHNNIAD